MEPSSFFFSRFRTFAYLPAFNFWLLLAPVSLSYDWQMGSIPLIQKWTDPRNLVSLIFYSFLLWTIFYSLSKVCHFNIFEYLGMYWTRARVCLCTSFITPLNSSEKDQRELWGERKKRKIDFEVKVQEEKTWLFDWSNVEGRRLGKGKGGGGGG